MRFMIGSSPMDEAKKLAFLQTIASPIDTFHTSNASGAGTQHWLQELQAAYIGTDGKYVGGGSQDTTTLKYATPHASFLTNKVTWDLARTFTLRTAVPRGRGHVGRFYYPCAAVVDDDGRWSVSTVTQTANAAKAMLDAVNSASKTVWPDGHGLSVFSPLGVYPNPVVRVEVGRAPDTQRRRTKSLLEEHVGVDLVGASSVRELRQRTVWE